MLRHYATMSSRASSQLNKSGAQQQSTLLCVAAIYRFQFLFLVFFQGLGEAHIPE